MSATSVNSGVNSNGDNDRLERLRKAEEQLFIHHLGITNSGSATIDKIDLLEGDHDYNFLFNFLPNTDVYRNNNINIQYQTSDLNQVLTQSSAKVGATKEYYLEKAAQLQDFWETVVPTREQYHDIATLFQAKIYRLRRIIDQVNKEMAFHKEITEMMATKELTSQQQEQIIESLKNIDEQRTISHQNYLQDDINDFRIPFFATDMSAANAKIHKEMFLVKDVVLKDLNPKFYEAYSNAIDIHIEYQVESKIADENQNPELSKLYGYMSQFSLNLKNQFLDVFNDKVENGTITEESLEESLVFFNSNFTAMKERLLPKMVEAIENGTNFEDLVNTNDAVVSSGFSGLKAEFDSIYNGLLDHAEGKKTIADLMREKAIRTTDLHTNGEVNTYELAQNLSSANRALLQYNVNYDLDNDGDVDSTDINALNEVLASKNSQFNNYVNAYNKMDINNDGRIDENEALNTLTNYINGVRKENDISDVDGNGVVNSNDLTIIKNFIRVDLGVELDLSGDNDTVIRNIIDFAQDTAERKLELWDLQDTKLEEYYDSAGQTYGARTQYYYRFLQAKWGDSVQSMGAAYIDSMLTYFGAYNDREANTWWTDVNDPRAQEFNDRIQQLNSAMDKNLDITKQASTLSDEYGNKWYGDFEKYDDYVQARVMSSLEIQKHRTATFGLFYRDADNATTEQTDKLFDFFEVTYADFYNNRYNWTVDVNEENSLRSIVDDYEEFGANIDVGNIALTTLRSINQLIYRSRHSSFDLSEEQDKMYNTGLQEYIDTYIEFREKVQTGEFTLQSPQAEAYQDKLEAKFDLLLNLGNLEAGTTKAVAFVDKDGDGLVSSEERANAHSDFDYAMRMQQILQTNDLTISEEGEEFLLRYDFNGDGAINELDYDVLDNVAGISKSYPIHNLMNVINKQTSIKEYLDARVELENEEGLETNTAAIRDFLASEIEFDQNIKENYWEISFLTGSSVEESYKEIEKIRIHIMDAIEKGEDTSELMRLLSLEKNKLDNNTIENAKAKVTVDYLKFLDQLEGGSGELVNKYLLDQDFFTPEVKDALEYINQSSISAEVLINMLVEDPESFIETVGYLKAAEKLELTDNFDQILGGELSTQQINFLKAVGKYSESREFIANEVQNELFISTLVDKFFGDGSLDNSELEDQYKDYIDLMVKYANINTNNIDDDAKLLIDDMTSTLFNSSTIRTINGNITNSIRPGVVSRRVTGRRRYSSNSNNSGSQENTNFYSNVNTAFKTAKLNSIAVLKTRDQLLTSLDLSQEDTEANKATMREFIQAQIDDYNTSVASIETQIEELGNSRYNQFKIRKLRAELREINKLLVSTNSLQSKFI